MRILILQVQSVGLWASQVMPTLWSQNHILSSKEICCMSGIDGAEEMDRQMKARGLHEGG